MKLFISWSGDLSKKIADTFRQWIPGVIQAAKPYYSPDDISKGTRWSSEISKELESSKLGIICLTRENTESPWIMFEAGALSKNLETSKVCPLLFDIDPSDIKGPLIQFQAAKFSKEEVKKVVDMINNELESNKLDSEVLEDVYEMWWPKLESQIKNILSSEKDSMNPVVRTERELLEEVLSLTREFSLDKKNRRSNIKIHPNAIEDIITSIEELVLSASIEDRGLIEDCVSRSHRALYHIVEACEGLFQDERSFELIHRIRRLRNRTIHYDKKENN